MALIKKNEMIKMEERTLKEKINDLRKEMIKINAQIAVGTIPEKPGRIKEIKRTIARLHTHINLKKIGGKKQV